MLGAMQKYFDEAIKWYEKSLLEAHSDDVKKKLKNL